MYDEISSLESRYQYLRKTGIGGLYRDRAETP